MNKETQDKLDLFIHDFLEVKEVKQYLLLKEQLSNSNEIQNLLEKLKSSQKEMALSLGTSNYHEKKDNYFQIKHEYETNPLIVNYLVLQDEVMILMNEVQDKLKEK